MEESEAGLTASQQAVDADPRVFGDRYQEQRLLKRGRGIETLCGVDLQTHAQVVIKTVATERISTGIRMRLEHEAEILRKIDSPLLTPLLSVGQHNGLFFMVTRYQAGMSLESLLKERRLSVPETLAVGQCVLSALRDGHEHDVLHRDVKPANIILDLTSSIHGAVLVDFGLAQSSQLDLGTTDPPLETARYLSPEQAGLLDAEVSACSDLYCTGIVLFECLAGRPPFEGQSIGEILRQHMTVAPAELRRLGLGVPRALDEVIQRLLLKDPRNRYQTAGGVLADLEAIAAAIARGEEEPALVVGLHDRRESLTEPAFVGREKELQSLEIQVRRTQSGRGGLVLLEAESGGGKTRLLGELALRCRRKDVWVLRGRAFDQIGQQPFQVLEGIADELLAACRAEPQRAQSIREAVGDRLEAVVAVQPRLAEVFGGTPSESLGPEVFGEARTVEALVTFLWALGSQDLPALILLDDCQWADESTLKLLRRWQSRRRMERGAQCHSLLVAAFRSEEVREGHVLRSLSPALQLRLPHFESQDIRLLAESMAGRLPVEAVDVIERLSDGSPFMASAVLRGMVESKALIAGAKGWRVERSAMDDVRSSRHAAEVLARRIDILPLVAIDLLKVAAVLGKEFDLTLASTLAGLLPGHTLVALRQAQQRHLVWTRPNDEQCVFVHDKVRETCLAMLTEEERQELHLAAAAQLEQRSPPPVFDLAYHYDMAGESDKALPHALVAAEQARSQHSLEIAQQQYRIALRGSSSADQAICYRIAEGWGDVQMLRGNYDSAWQMFEAAKFMAEGDVAWVKANVESKLGELAFKRGYMKLAAISLERGLSHLGRSVPRYSSLFLPLVLWEVIVQAAHTWIPNLFLGRKPLAGAEKALLSVRLYVQLARAYWFSKGTLPVLWAHLRGMNLAESYQPTLELAQTYSEHAPAMSLVPLYRRAFKYAERSYQLRKEKNDVWGQAQSLDFHGIALYAASRFDECIEKCGEAVRLLERTGDYWEMNIARYQIAASLYRLGDLSAAVAEAKRIHKSGLELGDIQASGIILDVWAWASGGKVPADSLQVELARERYDAQATAQVLVAEGVRLLSVGRPDDAVSTLEKARLQARKAGVSNAWVAPILPWLATALREQANSLQRYTPGKHKAIVRRARVVVRQALWVTRSFRNDLPHALREAALLMASLGRPRKARRFFDRSLAEADRQGARYERAQTLLHRGRVGRELGWPDAEQDLADAESLLASIHGARDLSEESGIDSAQAPATLSLVDRFETVLEIGRQIASALNLEQAYQAVHEAANRSLRCEQCVVLSVSGSDTDPAISVVCGEKRIFNRSLVRRTLESRGSIAIVDVTAEGNEKFMLPDVRSVLCTPVFVHDETVAVFCVTHGQIPGLFGEEEVRLADFIATIAGAAIENSQNFAQLQRMNVTLEQRVADRTADLQGRTEELARSNSELEQFAYVASHDLQEPLRTITGYCGLLQEECDRHTNEKAHEYITHAVDGANRMKTLINDLLAYSRVSSRGREFEATDCGEILNVALRNLQTPIAEADATVSHEPLPTVMADPTQLIQMFQNLVGNAVKFRGARCPEVHVGAQQRGREWCFFVRDNGIGIKPEEQERVFKIFHRLHGRSRYEGTGIGLAICRKTVERHGGRIWVESEGGAGSTFFFTLPIAHGDNPSENAGDSLDAD